MTNAVFDDLQLKRGDIEALQAVPANMLARCFENQAKETKTNYTQSLVFGPVVDGHVLPETIWCDKAPDLVRDIPFLMGLNPDETVTVIGLDIYSQLKDDVAMADVCARFALMYDYSVDQLLPIVRKYRELMPHLPDSELVVRISTDIGYRKGAEIQSNLLLARPRVPVFMYECVWKTPCFRGEWAVHGVELPFIFALGEYGTAWDREDTDALRAAADPENKRAVVGRQMFDAWVNFARSGNPSTMDLPWPAYDSVSRPTMVFGAESKVVNDPHRDTCGVLLSL